jgi:hypothetical protein
VFELLSQAHRYKDIAEELEMSYATVHTHIGHIYKKFQVGSRTEAVAKRLQNSIAFERPRGFNLDWARARRARRSGDWLETSPPKPAFS